MFAILKKKTTQQHKKTTKKNQQNKATKKPQPNQKTQPPKKATLPRSESYCAQLPVIHHYETVLSELKFKLHGRDIVKGRHRQASSQLQN